MESALQSRQVQGNANNAHTGQVITNLLQVLETDTTCDLGVVIASDRAMPHDRLSGSKHVLTCGSKQVNFDVNKPRKIGH